MLEKSRPRRVIQPGKRVMEHGGKTIEVRREGSVMKILIADDHPLFRAGLPGFLTKLGEDVQILEAENLDKTLQIMTEHPDLNLLLLDLFIPGMDEIAAIALIRERFPTVPIVILTASQEPLHAQQALQQGVMGFLPKTLAVEVILHALRMILAGGVFFPPDLMMTMSRNDAAVATVGSQEEDPKTDISLTPRQEGILRLMVKGQSNKEIALELDLSPGTVKVHVASIFRALKVRNRVEAVTVAMNNNLLPSIGVGLLP